MNMAADISIQTDAYDCLAVELLISQNTGTVIGV